MNLAMYFLIQSICFFRSISLLMLNDVRAPLSNKKESVNTRDVRNMVDQRSLETCRGWQRGAWSEIVRVF
jgi:hypothetical protein